MAKICTDIGQSKRLLELGIDPGTADMSYLYDREDNSYMKDPIVGILNYDDDEIYKDIPAWSLSALLELMPQTIDKDDKWLLCLERCYHRIINRFICRYPNVKSTEVCDSPLDAVFEMVVWLLEKGHIKTDKA